MDWDVEWMLGNRAKSLILSKGKLAWLLEQEWKTQNPVKSILTSPISENN